MKKHILRSLTALLLVTSSSTHVLIADEKLKPSPSFAVDVNIPSFDQKIIQSALISTVGLVASSVALVLIGKGVIALSTSDTSGNASNQSSSTPLFVGGSLLLLAGALTIKHPQIIDYMHSH